jgi:hypothetical protein
MASLLEVEEGARDLSCSRVATSISASVSLTNAKSFACPVREGRIEHRIEQEQSWCNSPGDRTRLDADARTFRVTKFGLA